MASKTASWTKPETACTTPSLAQVGLGRCMAFRLLLMALVVIIGAANNVAKQIAGKPLQQYTYLLGLGSAFINVPLWGSVFLYYRSTGEIPRSQLDFIQQKITYRGWPVFPVLLLFLGTALGDTLGNVIGIICSPYVSGPVQSLLASCTTLFIAILSLVFFGKRYSLGQCAALLGLFGAVVVGALPSFASNDSATNPTFAVIQGSSCVFNAVSIVLQEFIFLRFKHWEEGCGRSRFAQAGLNVVIVSLCKNAFCLPFTMLLVPFNKMLGLMHSQTVLEYLRDGITCIFSGVCGTSATGADFCWLTFMVYLALNATFNILVLLSVKHSGALSTFVALKAIFPVSTLLFAYVDWPLLGVTHVHVLIWVSMAILFPFMYLFQLESRKQADRYVGESMHEPSHVLCCFPLFNFVPRSDINARLLDASDNAAVV